MDLSRAPSTAWRSMALSRLIPVFQIAQHAKCLFVRVLTRRATARSPTHSNSRRASLRGAAAPHPAIHMTAHPFRNVSKI